MTASPRRHYRGHHKAAEEEGHPKTFGKGIWSKRCKQRVSGTDGGGSIKQR